MNHFIEVTATHNIFDVEIEKDIECKEHTDEVIKHINITVYKNIRL